MLKAAELPALEVNRPFQLTSLPMVATSTCWSSHGESERAKNTREKLNLAAKPLHSMNAIGV